mmetsp:Transcript_43400/g.68729  ORF Transcript_43400/g.68729 Transcript_43400/m.68729 type:complete len:199 (+) Transcript_43400:84-680(+)|eukprot:CAMPEP_0169110244 /NCGR_PEP_ID=MMETSP1015-20121227/26408_1 /TAXON_ID=342587 /ORGANISM="Karlodinium micrum, Strain CCMP2283" /LENGTH=198 /DNA_ID=CAMNT_0009172021 /DNA_START=74 /DNA_END=670 /DNA_ORIENTATION=-
MLPMVGLFYLPLLLWLPLLLIQVLAATSYVTAVKVAKKSNTTTVDTKAWGRSTLETVKGVTWLLVESPLAYVLKIFWIVMLVFSFASLWGVLSAPSGGQDLQIIDAARNKESFLVLVANLVAMIAIHTIHHLSDSHLITEKTLYAQYYATKQMKQGQSQGLANLEVVKDPKPSESKMPEESKADKENEKDSELRKRAD